MSRAGRGAAQVDLAGKTLVPGFIDSHGHVDGVGLQAVAANLLPPPDGRNDSIPALQQTMRDWIANSPIPKQYGVILGFGYDDSQLKEQRHPTRDELDAISTELPIILLHQSAHMSTLNSKALAELGVTAATADPPGGVIRRRAGSQEPNGVLEEIAHFFSVYKDLEEHKVVTIGDWEDREAAEALILAGRARFDAAQQAGAGGTRP
jgi:predicted amidohydrolase YtcJ